MRLRYLWVLWTVLVVMTISSSEIQARPRRSRSKSRARVQRTQAAMPAPEIVSRDVQVREINLGPQIVKTQDGDLVQKDVWVRERVEQIKTYEVYYVKNRVTKPVTVMQPVVEKRVVRRATLKEKTGTAQKGYEETTRVVE